MNNFERQGEIDTLLENYSTRELADLLINYHLALDDVLSLMDGSEGVSGLHLNGEVAKWDWLLDNWLASVYNMLGTHYDLGGTIEQTTS